MKLLLRLLVNAAALWAAIALLPGIHWTGRWWQLLFVALVFGVVNAIVRPILTLLSLPFIIVTLGLFILVLNAAMLLLTAWLSRAMGLPLVIDSFWSAFLGALVISIVSFVLSVFVRDGKDKERERD